MSSDSKPQIVTGSNKVFMTGGSLAVTLPKAYVKGSDITKGDQLLWVVSGDTIRLFPIDKNSQARIGKVNSD